ncbi:MAG: DUF3631 domain-containing protein, partial [Yaniella sp.]|nr:DUF3631 domain-containing protein [Yaniella sp.]
HIDLADSSSSSTGSSDSSGYLWGVLDEVDQWLRRFILATTPEDIHLITLWAAHTYVVEETYTSPRLLIDSVMPGAGKTTVLEHLDRLTRSPLSASSISSEALLPRVLDRGIRTILIDEADRSLDPKDPVMKGVIATINTGYKRGGSRPVLVKDNDGNWTDREMSTYAPVAMAGNNPTLADDTRSRCIRILLMPDFEGRTEDSDWEDLEAEVDQLKVLLDEAMEAARDSVSSARPELPEKCIGRMREKWRPLARIAYAAGGDWPTRVTQLINRDIEELEMERAEGVQNLPLRVHLLKDIAEVWPNGESFIASQDLVQRLAVNFPARWGIESVRGLKVQGLGRMLMQGYKINSDRETTGQRRRGYYITQFTEAWQRFQVQSPQHQPDEPDKPVQPDQIPGITGEQQGNLPTASATEPQPKETP